MISTDRLLFLSTLVQINILFAFPKFSSLLIGPNYGVVYLSLHFSSDRSYISDWNYTRNTVISVKKKCLRGFSSYQLNFLNEISIKL